MVHGNECLSPLFGQTPSFHRVRARVSLTVKTFGPNFVSDLVKTENYSGKGQRVRVDQGFSKIDKVTPSTLRSALYPPIITKSHEAQVLSPP